MPPKGPVTLLIHALKGGDKKAAQKLWERYYGRLVRLARKKLADSPRRMADVWTDADYRMAESRAEVLLLAALDYCTERVVVHLSPRPPRTILRQLAERLGLKILHVPLGTLSRSTEKKIRVMHILSGHEKRRGARDYIW